MGKKRKLKNAIVVVCRVLPVAVITALGIAWLFSGKDLSPETLRNLTPASPVAAALFLMLIYAAKSLSVLFPILLLYVFGGMLFPLIPALLVNTLGTAVAATVPYWIGRHYGGSLADKLTAKRPKLAEIRHLRQENDLFFSYILRAVSALPYDIVSLYLGAIRVPYPKYIAGSVLGSLPLIITTTVFGKTVSQPGSPEFIISLAAVAATVVLSLLWYLSYRRKLRARRHHDVNP